MHRAAFVGLLVPAVVLAAVLAARPGGAAPGGSAVSGPAARLGVWEGRWTISERDYQTAYSRAHTNSVMADCGWARNRGFMVCDYLNSNPGNGVPDNDLAIFSYSPTSKSYARVGVFKGEKPLWERLNVNGNTWTASFNFPYKGATLTYRDVYVYSPDGTRTTTTAQVTADGGHTWTTVSHFAGVKAGP